MKHEKCMVIPKCLFMFHVFMFHVSTLQSRDTDVVGTLHSRKWVLRKLLDSSHAQWSGADRRGDRAAHVRKARGWKRTVTARRSRDLSDTSGFRSLQLP